MVLGRVLDGLGMDLGGVWGALGIKMASRDGKGRERKERDGKGRERMGKGGVRMHFALSGAGPGDLGKFHM
jgi:hypothetical protein